MKLLRVALFLAVLPVSFAFPQEDAGGNSAKLLTRDQRVEIRKLLAEAEEAFRQKRFNLASKNLDVVEAIFPDFAEALAMRGALLSEQHDFEKAEELFDRALQMDSSLFSPRFNKAESLLLQGKYEESKAAFEKLRDWYPYTDLVRFKLVLLNLKLGNPREAKATLDTITFPGDTAAYYYARAAMDIFRGDNKEAESWIKSAEHLYGVEPNFIFYDSLADLGLVEKRMPR